MPTTIMAIGKSDKLSHSRGVCRNLVIDSIGKLSAMTKLAKGGKRTMLFMIENTDERFCVLSRNARISGNVIDSTIKLPS